MRRLDLDDVGAHVGERPGHRGRPEHRALDDADPGQGAGRVEQRPVADSVIFAPSDGRQMATYPPSVHAASLRVATIARWPCPTTPSVAPASDGRIPGPRGLATRNRLIECTAAIVATTPYSDLRVTDVARAAGTSPATFYQYFVDLDAALLVLADQTTEIGAQLAGFIQDRRWRGKAGYASALASWSTASSTSGRPTCRCCASSTCSPRRATPASGRPACTC